MKGWSLRFTVPWATQRPPCGNGKDGNLVEIGFGVFWVNPAKLGYFTQVVLLDAMRSFERKSFAKLVLAPERRHTHVDI